MGPPSLAVFSPEEYLEIENRSPERHEYYDGYLIAMAGASRGHLELQTNLIRLIANRFRANNRPCKPYGSDARVWVSKSKYFYPDISIFCGKQEADEQNNWREPQVVIEILSDSTASFDLNEKAAAYRQMPSLTELVLVDSRAISLIIIQKQSDGAWVERTYGDQTKSVVIAGEDIQLSEIYEGVF